MFADWVTVSFGKIEQYEVRGALFERIRVLKRVYPHSFTRSTYGSLSVCLPGQHWQTVDEADGFKIVDDVLHFCATGHVTRFDLAHDWSLEKADSDQIWAAVDQCGLEIEKLTGSKGTTWYINSRESGRFGRLYDKHAEILARTGVDVKFSILRFEVELKQECAPEYFAHFRRCPETVVGDVAQRFNLTKFLEGSSKEVIRCMGAPAADPFAFVRKFYKCISYARALDPKLFDEIIPAHRHMPVLPGVPT
jgi:hypothetical protein